MVTIQHKPKWYGNRFNIKTRTRTYKTTENYVTECLKILLLLLLELDRINGSTQSVSVIYTRIYHADPSCKFTNCEHCGANRVVALMVGLF